MIVSWNRTPPISLISRPAPPWVGRARVTARNQLGQPSNSSASAWYTVSGAAVIRAAKVRRTGAFSMKSSPTGRSRRAMAVLPGFGGQPVASGGLPP